MPHPQPRTTCISSLPSEINQKIFNSFTRLHCLQCMLVCRLWRERMPKWSVDHWRSIRLSNNDLEQLGPLLSLVGSHVRQIVMVQPSEKSIIKVMHSLIDMGLTHLSTFMIAIDDKCDLVPSSTFSTFTQYMTRLHIGSTHSRYDILGILACCPQLTHFSSSSRFHASRKITRKFLPSSSSSSSSSCLRLQYLRLNHGISTDQLLDIIHASPNMRHLRIQWNSNIDWIKIVEARPELDMITWNIFPSLGDDDLWLTDYHTPCNHLRTLEIGDILHETPLHHIMAIMNCPWGKRLERLSCDIGKLYKSKDTMRKMPAILSPPDTCQLQEFIYNSHKADMDDIHDPEDTIMVPILSRCKQLQSVTIDMDASRGGLRTPNEQILPELTFFNHLPYLRHLSIHEDRDDLSDLSFMLLQMKHFGVQLESFEYRIPMITTSLEFIGALITIPTMRHLILKEAYSGCIKYEALESLARFQNQSSPIVTLTLQAFALTRERSYEALCDMAGIKHLILKGYLIDVSGLKYLADHHTSLDTLELVNITVRKNKMHETKEYLKSKIKHVIWEC